MFENLFSGIDWGSMGDFDWGSIFGDTSSPAYQYKTYDPFVTDNTLDLTSNTGGLNSLDTYNFGGESVPYDLPGALASSPTYSNIFSDAAKSPGPSWMDTLKSGGNYAVGTAKEYPLATTLGLGVGAQGLSSIFENRKANKDKDALRGAASNYMNALQTGKTEATSQFLQNTAAKKAALLNKLGGNVADSGGANPRRVMNKFNREANEGFGNFQLNLAQQKTPDLSAFTTGVGGKQSGSEAFLGGLLKGGAQTAGNVGSIYLANLLKGLFT